MPAAAALSEACGHAEALTCSVLTEVLGKWLVRLDRARTGDP